MVRWSNGNWCQTQSSENTVQFSTTTIERGLKPLYVRTDPKPN